MNIHMSYCLNVVIPKFTLKMTGFSFSKVVHTTYIQKQTEFSVNNVLRRNNEQTEINQLFIIGVLL